MAKFGGTRRGVSAAFAVALNRPAPGEPVTVQAAGSLELALHDRSIQADRAAAKLGVALDGGLFDWQR
jgi:hypothetical protein